MRTTDGADVAAGRIAVTLAFLVVVGLPLSLIFAGSGTVRADILFPAALFVMVFRAYSLTRSITWIARKGSLFKEQRASWTEPLDRRTSREALYDAADGAYFPFGVKAYRLHRWVRAYQGRWYRPVTLPLSLVGLVWRFYFFTPLFCVLIVVLARTPHAVTPWQAWTGLIAAVVLMVSTIVIAAEAVLSYIAFGSWAALHYPAKSDTARAPAELSVFVGSGIMALLAAAAATMFASERWDSFSNVPAQPGWLATVGRSAYYAWTALTGNGDAGPVDAQGRLITSVTYVQSVAFLVLALAAVGAFAFSGTDGAGGEAAENSSGREREAVPSPAEGTSELAEHDPVAPAKLRSRTTLACFGIAAAAAVVAFRATKGTK